MRGYFLLDMKVKFTKTHLDNKAKSTKVVNDDLGSYLCKMGVATEVKKKPAAKKKTAKK